MPFVRLSEGFTITWSVADKPCEISNLSPRFRLIVILRLYVYDLDSLQTIADRTLSKREEEIEACDSLIEKHVCDFQVWLDRASERVMPNRGDRAPANVKPIGLESTLL